MCIRDSAHAGQGAHQRGLDGVDGLRVEVLTVGGVLLLQDVYKRQLFVVPRRIVGETAKI